MTVKLRNTLENVVCGDPWYGASVLKILNQIKETKVSVRRGHAHTMAEILIHMIAWTEEVTSRLQGNAVKEPSRGDWPDPCPHTWQELVKEFETANQELLEAIANFSREKWDESVQYFRDPALGTGVTCREMLEGLIQHHVYHVGQIAILNKL